MTPPATAAARRSTAPRPAPTRPRRVSGPAHPVAVPRPARRRAGVREPIPARALGWVQALPDHRLLDRLIGGRVWIVLLGTLLVGIVTLQLTMLKLNAGIGGAVERTAQLEQRNATLRASISQLSDSARIVSEGTRMGLVMPPQGSPRFLDARAGDARRALTVMRVPLPTSAVTIPAPVVTDATTPVTDASTTAADTTATATADPVTTTTTTTTTDPATTAPVTPVDGGATTTTTPDAATATTPAGGAAAPQG